MKSEYNENLRNYRAYEILGQDWRNEKNHSRIVGFKELSSRFGDVQSIMFGLNPHGNVNVEDNTSLDIINNSRYTQTNLKYLEKNDLLEERKIYLFANLIPFTSSNYSAISDILEREEFTEEMKKHLEMVKLFFQNTNCPILLQTGELYGNGERMYGRKLSKEDIEKLKNFYKETKRDIFDGIEVNRLIAPWGISAKGYARHLTSLRPVKFDLTEKIIFVHNYGGQTEGGICPAAENALF